MLGFLTETGPAHQLWIETDKLWNKIQVTT